MERERIFYCNTCKVPLEKKQTTFYYLDHSFHEEVLRCPKCGQALIEESLAKGRMAEVEAQLEDK